ncbi:DUF418 domain-containing protein [Novosphingopyxis sp.]|uniref:DUF418 domain-containing protein n=1 Tax=Novosphingopyxis sp. TaxID=2709690 RepID=UPI003B5BD5EE
MSDCDETEPPDGPVGSVLDARSIELDALRGLAVMSILAMNIVAFALPENAYIVPRVAGTGAATGGDIAAWIAAFLLFDGKMRGLFSLLFGASMYLIAERADMQGGSAARTHYSRMAWLAVFGAAHFFLIWWGDILFLYAVIGSLAFLMKAASRKTLIATALIVYAAGAALMSLSLGTLLSAEMAAHAPGASAASIERLAHIMQGFSPATEQEEIALFRGTYGATVEYRLSQYWRPLNLLFQAGTETFPLMLLGMVGLRSGFLTGHWETRRYWLVVAILFVPGLLIYAGLAAFDMARGFDPILSLNLVVAWSLPPRLMMTLGYAALFLLLIRWLARSALLERIAAAGQAAFTNYLGTSIVMSTIFYGYGLDLFGQVPRPALYLFVLAACAVMLLWSKPWLDRYRYGPLEWLWRSLARGRLQPMLKVRSGA